LFVATRSEIQLRLFGEVVREVATLVGVFAPLDALIQKDGGGWGWGLTAIVSSALLFVCVGITLEAEAESEG
jgi:hypothetical protein